MGRIEDFLRKSKLDHERAVGKRIPIGANYSKQSLMKKPSFKNAIATYTFRSYFRILNKIKYKVISGLYK